MQDDERLGLDLAPQKHYWNIGERFEGPQEIRRGKGGGAMKGLILYSVLSIISPGVVSGSIAVS